MLQKVAMREQAPGKAASIILLIIMEDHLLSLDGRIDIFHLPAFVVALSYRYVFFLYVSAVRCIENRYLW